MKRVLSGCAESLICTAICADVTSTSIPSMQLSDAMGAGPPIGAEPCRFPKLEECAHFHYERVQLPKLEVLLQNDMDKSLHSQHTVSSLDGSYTDPTDYYTLQVTCRDECWLIQRNLENFAMLDSQLHQCIYDRKVSQLRDLNELKSNKELTDYNSKEFGNKHRDENDLEAILSEYLDRLCSIIDNSLNCGPILNWFQLDNRGHRLLVPSEESRSINTPAVAAAYSVRKYVSQARDELSLEVGDMISVIDMASPGESVWWRGKRGFQVGFFPQHCVHIIGDKVPRNMPLPPPVVGSLAISPIKPVLRKHGKLITFFRSFILNRPSRRRLKQSGILKERVFGCDLGEHLLNSGHDIPMVLKCCAEFIETHGIVDGIYRLSGVTSNIQKLRNAFDEDRIPNLYTDDILKDIHSVASLLKMYFRELPNPLCTYQLYHSFVTAVQGCTTTRSKANDNERLLKMREAVQKLPPPHYRTLEYLVRHLSRIAAHGSKTGMTTRNIAIVWAPNLLRCEELEVGGVAALQGVGVQAVVTEFLVCYADLIFSDRIPVLEEWRQQYEERECTSMSPKRSRPKSLAISTPTKLLTLEEARNKHLLNKSDEGNYIEVGGGPKSLPKKYHTVIELPAGSRKRGLSKRSPSGWRSFFSKSRNSSHGNLSKRDISSPGILGITPIDKSVTESDLNEIKRKLRPVKSAESLTSGQSEPATCESDILGPLNNSLAKTTGHNRSVSHDSYFDNLQSSQNNSIGSLLDLSEIQLNFELEESEMRIFSEDESLISSPKVQKDGAPRKHYSRSNHETCSGCNSLNPSPKKQPRVVASPDSLSRKRSRLEDQLSDIQYIDCNTPENPPCVISTTAMVHQCDDSLNRAVENSFSGSFEAYQPRNKSPRNSEANNRYSLNFEKMDPISPLPKSLTDMDIKAQMSMNYSANLTPTPQTPNYKPLDSTSTTNTPILSPILDSVLSPVSRNTSNNEENTTSGQQDQNIYENVQVSTKLNENKNSPTYENILTTINIIYKSPTKTKNNTDNIYEDIELNPEKAVVPTVAAELPKQEASQPIVENILSTKNSSNENLTNIHHDSINVDLPLKECGVEKTPNQNIPLEDIFTSNLTALSSPSDGVIENSDSTNLSSLPSTPTGISAKISLETTFDDSITTIASDSNTLKEDLLLKNDLSSSSDSRDNEVADKIVDNCENDKNYKSFDSLSSDSVNITPVENISRKSLINTSEDLTISDVMPLTSNSNSLSNLTSESSDHISSLSKNKNDDSQNLTDKRKSCELDILDENAIYQQVKYFRRSIHEINSLLDLSPSTQDETLNSLEKNRSKSIDNFQNLEANEEINHFDSLESQNVHIYENISLKSSNKSLNSPKTLKISTEIINELPSCKKCSNVSPLQTPTEIKKDCVKTLTSKFEQQQDNASHQTTEITSNKSNIQKSYDKDNLPPCLRAKNAKNSVKTRSLDENAFTAEFTTSQNVGILRRKSLDDRTSSYIDTKLLEETSAKLNSISSHDVSKPNVSLSKISGSDQTTLNRERIEKYKEERRLFLREKYRSESFKQDKDVILSRLKQKSLKTNKPEDQTCQSTQNSQEKYKKLPLEALSKFETSPSVVKKEKSPLLDRKNSRTSIKKLTDDPNVDAIERTSKPVKEEEFIRDKKPVEERKRHTLELERERSAPSDLELKKRTSLDSKMAPKTEKCQPTYCIKDMKAIFENKTQH